MLFLFLEVVSVSRNSDQNKRGAFKIKNFLIKKLANTLKQHSTFKQSFQSNRMLDEWLSAIV